MKKIILAFLFLIILPSLALSATNHYIRQGATGTADGSDWTNAFTDIPATLTRGDTYFIADGAYAANGYVFDDSVIEPGVWITIKKATVAAHGTDTGWDNAYGDGVATFGDSVEGTCTPFCNYVPVLKFKTSYYVFDGVTGGGYGSWNSGHGFKIANTSYVVFIMISDNYGNRWNVDHITISHCDIGNSNTLTDYENFGGRAIGITANAYLASFNNLTFSYNYIHDIGSAHFAIKNGTNITLEQNYITRNASISTNHGVLIRMDNSTGVTVRYNFFEDGAGTGFFGSYDGTNDDYKFYGNIFSNSNNGYAITCQTSDTCDSVGPPNASNGIFSNSGSGNTATNYLIYNNTFVNMGLNKLVYFNSTTSSGHLIKNNIFYLTGYAAASMAWPASGTRGYNYYSSPDGPQGETDNPQNAGTANPFTSWTTGDFTLASNTTAGVNLGSPYNVDMAGNTRSTWSRGALEFNGEADSTAPTLAEVTPVTASSTNQSPQYVFSSDEVGTITYGGTCGIGTLSTATIGNNTTNWNLGVGTYSNCTITVTDAASNASDALAVTEFVIVPTAGMPMSAGGGTSFSGSLP